MTFAQRSVAGEEDTRPYGQIRSADDIEAPARKRLKRKTMEAVELASRISGLGRSARAALAALARTANNDDPNGRIFKHRETLCTETGMSPATWYRVQKELVTHGLITVDSQVRKRYGRFAGAYIYLTVRATDMLGLTTPSAAMDNAPAHEEETNCPSCPEPASADKPSLKTRVPFTEERSPYAFQKRHQGTLPSDLERLRTLDFDEKLIFWLMRKAREAGHLLSQVVECTWDSIRKASRPKAYLLALLGRPTDYARVLTLRTAKRAAAGEKRRVEAEVQATLAAAARKIYIDHRGTKFEVESDGRSVVMVAPNRSEVRRIVGAALQPFADAIKAGLISVSEPAEPVCVPLVSNPPRSSPAALDQLATLRQLVGLQRRGDVIY